MNNKYALLQQAYQLRDHYALIVFVVALLLLFTQDQLRSWPRWRFTFLLYVLIAWISLTIYGLIGGGL
jgi:hypothetical protein